MDRDEIASKAKIGDIVEVKAQKPKLQKSIRKKLGLTEKFDYYAGFVSINPKTIGVSHIKEAGELEYFIKYEDILEFEVLKSGV